MWWWTSPPADVENGPSERDFDVYPTCGKFLMEKGDIVVEFEEYDPKSDDVVKRAKIVKRTWLLSDEEIADWKRVRELYDEPEGP